MKKILTICLLLASGLTILNDCDQVCNYFLHYFQHFQVLGIHDLFGTELAMIFSFHVGLTDSVMQRMYFFSCQCLFDIFLPPHCQIFYFNIRKKLNDLLSVQK
jgi:hypothetical protein